MSYFVVFYGYRELSLLKIWPYTRTCKDVLRLPPWSISVSHTKDLSSFIHSSMALQPFVGPWPLIHFRIFFTRMVGLLGRVIGPSQGRYLHRGQHKHRLNAHTDIHALSGIRIHDPSVRASEDSSSLDLACTVIGLGIKCPDTSISYIQQFFEISASSVTVSSFLNIRFFVYNKFVHNFLNRTGISFSPVCGSRDELLFGQGITLLFTLWRAQPCLQDGQLFISVTIPIGECLLPSVENLLFFR
jgi:hypothetical protein